MENTQKHSPIWKSLITSIVFLAVVIGAMILFQMAKLPFWPFILFLFWYSTVLKTDPTAFYPTVVGGAIGLVVSYSTVYLTPLIGATNALIVLLAIVVILLTILLDGRFKYVEGQCFMLITVLLYIPGIITSPLAGTLPTILISYAIAVAVFVVIGLIFKARVNAAVKKADKQANAS